MLEKVDFDRAIQPSRLDPEENTALPSQSSLPIPPRALREAVGPFADANLFERSGGEAAAEIIRLCQVSEHSRVLEIGCGCGRLARALADHLTPHGDYEGFDVDTAAIEWCNRNLAPRLPRFHFMAVNVRAGAHNPSGSIPSEQFCFPYPDRQFDLAIASSVFTHMRPEGIARYVSETRRVLRRGGKLFLTVLLFDDAAEIAVRTGATIFHFIHAIGPCLTFDAEHPEEGVACREDWLLDVLTANGLVIDGILRGNWRTLRSYVVRHDYVHAQNT